MTRREIRLWARVQLSDPHAGAKDRVAAGVVTAKGFREGLTGAAAADARQDEVGRICTVRNPLSSRGAYAPRFAARPVIAKEATACLIEDLATLLRPEREVQGIEDLRAEAQEIGSRVLADIADIRERALGAAVLRALPEEICDPSEVTRACAVAASGREVVAGWAAEVVPNRRGYPNGPGEVPGFLWVAEQWQGGAGEHRVPRTVDQTIGIAMQEFEALAREALSIGEREVQHWSPVVAEARRIRGPLTGGNSWDDPSDPQSLLDRPDALVAILGNCHLPMIGALVDTAAATLGHVVRDPDPLLRALERTGAGEAMTRKALVVALGLLGDPPPLELAWVNPYDPEEAAAYYASISLGVDDEVERIRLGRVADRTARGAALEVSERALLELESGVRLGVIG